MRVRTNAMPWLVSAGLALGLAGCVFDGSPRRRVDDGCFIGGCAAEVCSDRDDVASPCIWREVFACFRTATCERQVDGACGWTQTAELEACLASHESLPSSSSFVSHP